MRAFSEGLERHRDLVNRLNVYPVPDGDTGTNMALTVESVVKALEAVDLETLRRRGDGSDVQGDLRAARSWGHGATPASSSARSCAASSGTFAPCRAGRGRTRRWSRLTEGSAAARAGVMRPVEGTMLTVAATPPRRPPRSTSRPARTSLAVFEAARHAAVASLWRTPELLPVLAQAGVVDAGGAGLVLLYDAFLHVLDGRPLAGVAAAPARRSRTTSPAALSATRPAPRSGTGRRPQAPTARRHLRRTRAEGDEEGSGVVGPALRGHVLPRGARRGARRVQGRLGRASATRSSSSAATACGTATSTPTTSGRRSRRRSTSGARATSASPTSSTRSRRSRGCGGRARVRPGRAGRSPRSPAPVTSVVAVATGDGIRRIFYSLGVHHIVGGGQSMNPSTEQILEVIESRTRRRGRDPAEQQEHHRRRQAGLRAVSASRPSSSTTAGHPGGLRRPAWSTTRRRRARRTLRPCRRPPTGCVRARSPGPCGRATSPSGHDRGRGLDRPVAETGIESVAAVRCPRPPAACSPSCSTTGDEIVTLIEGAGATAADTRRITEWLRETAPEVSPSSCTTAASRSTRTSSRSSEPGGGRPQAAVSRGASASRELRSVKARKAAASSRWASRPCSTCSCTTRAATSTAATSPRSPPLAEDEEAMVTATVRRVSTRRTSEAARSMVEVVVDDGTGRLSIVLLQPAVAGPAARGGPEVVVFGQDRDLPGRPPDDEPGRRPRRRPDRPARPHLPAVGQGEDRLDRDRRLRRRGARADGRVRRAAAGRGACDELGLRRADRGVPAASTPPRPSQRARAGPPPPRLRRAAAAPARPRAEEAGGRRRGAWHRARDHVAARWAATSSTSSSRGSRSSSPAPSGVRSTRWRPTSRAPHPMHRLLQGDVGAGQDRRRPRGPALRRPGRPPGRAHGPDRGARRAALPRGPRASSAGLEVPDPARLGGARPLTVALLTSRTTAGRAARGSRPSCVERHPRPRRRHPRAVDRGRPFRLARRRRDRRAAPFRGRAAGGAAREGPAASVGDADADREPAPGRARHDGDARSRAPRR